MDFDFGEHLFGRLWRRWRGRGGDAQPRPDLTAVAPRLQAVAGMFAGTRVHLRAAESVGGVRGRVLLLPAPAALPEDEEVGWEEFLLVRTVLGAAQVAAEIRERAGAADPGGETHGAGTPVEAELRAMLRAREQAEALGAELPGFWSRYLRALHTELAHRPWPERLSPSGARMEELRRMLLAGEPLPAEPADLAAEVEGRATRGRSSPGVMLWGGALTAPEAEAADAFARRAEEELAEAGVAEDASERAAPPRDWVRRALLEEDPDKDVMPEHVFEKIETAEEYVGGRRRLDGEDDLADHADALDELDLREVVRGGPEVHSVYRAELGDAGVPDVRGTAPGENAVLYDEWDAGRGRYRRRWAAVYPARATASRPGAAAALATRNRAAVAQLVRRLERDRHARQRESRRLDGPELDLGAWVLDSAAVRAGRPGDGRLWIRRRARRRDLATTLLLDVSLSAESWVEDRRVLDAVEEASVVLGEVADELGDPLCVQAFASNTRNLNRVWTVKDWREEWSAARDRLAALRTQGYTRIGPALRHAAAGLARRPERHRLLLLLTDGKPTDFDRYEGRYGRADVRRAVDEAWREGVRVHAIGFDPGAAAQLGEMFGAGAWGLARNLSDLNSAVLAAYRRFAGSA